MLGYFIHKIKQLLLNGTIDFRKVKLEVKNEQDLPSVVNDSRFDKDWKEKYGKEEKYGTKGVINPPSNRSHQLSFFQKLF